ncbi:hypothetical protein CCR75_006308 [Bremia lactucae]|nr:hypothetical protein CCR75_006308 [Bremia lactucae]
MIANKFTKFLYILFHAFFYVGRPLIVNPKKPGKWEYINAAVCLSYDCLIYVYGGLSGFLYLLLGTMLGCGIHPVAGHFIAEHYEFTLGYETYSYYGILNRLTFNVGLHNEHHDFPFVAGSRLHEVRALAPEFYENLPSHKSWVKVLVDFIMDESMNPFSRVKRQTIEDNDQGKIKSE